MFKYFVSISAGLFIAVAACAQAPDLERMDIVLKSMPDGPLAKVGDKNIGRAEFVRLYSSELDRIARSGGPRDLPNVDRARLAMEVLRVLVERTLLYDDAIRRKITVPKESVEKAWDAQLAQLQQQLMQKDGREYSEDDVLSEMGYSERGEVLADLRRALITDKMRATVIREGELAIDDAEIREVFNAKKELFSRPSTLHIKQLFFDPDEDSPQKGAARERAEDARGRIFAGQSFGAVARAASDAPDAKRGGNMGVLPMQKYPPFMVEVAKLMEPGDISEIFESEFGVHVIKLVAKRDGSAMTVKEAEPLIRRELLKQRGGATIMKYCEALVDEGKEIRLFLELDKNLGLANRSLRAEGE